MLGLQASLHLITIVVDLINLLVELVHLLLVFLLFDHSIGVFESAQILSLGFDSLTLAFKIGFQLASLQFV